MNNFSDQFWCSCQINSIELNRKIEFNSIELNRKLPTEKSPQEKAHGKLLTVKSEINSEFFFYENKQNIIILILIHKWRIYQKSI